MNQGKLEVVKQEMARVNVDILGISELQWTGMGEFISDNHYIYYCGQESFRRNGVAIMVNKRVRNAVQFSHSVMSDSLRPHESQHARPPCPSPTWSSLRLMTRDGGREEQGQQPEARGSSKKEQSHT